jgi:conserved domain protein|nr:MAG TPA: Protein of unknown function (DUF3644) [Caudoviricetes sp.]
MNEKQRLIDKSIEAFILGLEIYNKPTIKYRIEGFSFFIVNAWELMLKAELINRDIELFYKDNPERTLSIDAVIKKIYTDERTRVRQNLEKIVDLRNLSTHFITEDYEIKYVPLFQACVLNFVNEIQRFHKVDITESLSSNFLTLSARIESLSEDELRAKYPAHIAEKFIQQTSELSLLYSEYNSEKFSINFEQHLYITKKKKNSDFTVSIAKDSKNRVAIIKDFKDPSNTHGYSYKTIINVVDERLKRENVRFDYAKGFNSYVLNLFLDFYDIKNDDKYSYKHVIGNQNTYTYSSLLIDFIVEEIKKAPNNFVSSLKSSKLKR